MVFVSAYMLWQCRRTMFGRVTSASGTTFGDLTPRELAMFVPLVALSLWIGSSSGTVCRHARNFDGPGRRARQS